MGIDEPHAVIAQEPPAPTAPPVPAKASKGPKIAGVALGLVLLGGGAAFAYTQFFQNKTNTPVQAVESFYTALAKGDVIGLAETLEPGERDILLDSVVPMVAELNRLEFFDKADLKSIKGFEGSLTDFQATHTKLRSDLAEVNISRGSLKTSVNLKTLPLGKNIKDFVGTALDSSKPSSTTNDLAGQKGFIVHKTGSKWRVSLNYSVAEASRRSASDSGDAVRPIPLVGAGVKPKGAATPHEAVAQMMQAVADLNVQSMIELVPPDELPALQNYADFFLEDAKTAVKEATSKYTLKVDPKLRETSIGTGRTLVTIEDLPFKLNVAADPLTVKLNYADSVASLDASLSDGQSGSLGSAKANYDHGDFNLAVKSNDGLKITASKVKKDLRAAYTGLDGSTAEAKFVGGVLDAKLAMPDGTSGVASYRDGMFNANIKASDGTTGTATFKDNKLDAAITFPDGSASTAKFADECLIVTSGDNEKKACGKDEILKTFFGGTGTTNVATQGFGGAFVDRLFPSEKATGSASTANCARALKRPQIGFVTVKRDGKWYVSPSRTMLDAFTAQLKQYQPADIDCFRSQFKQVSEQIKQQIEAQQQVQGFNETTDTVPAVDESFSASSDLFTNDTFAPDTFVPDTFDPDTSDTFASDTFVPDTFPADPQLAPDTVGK